MKGLHYHCTHFARLNDQQNMAKALCSKKKKDQTHSMISGSQYI